MAIGNIYFKHGTKEEYDLLPVKSSNTIYFIDDTKEIFKGEDRFSSGDVASLLKDGLMSKEDKAVLDNLDEYEAIVDGVVSDVEDIFETLRGMAENIESLSDSTDELSDRLDDLSGEDLEDESIHSNKLAQDVVDSINKPYIVETNVGSSLNLKYRVGGVPAKILVSMTSGSGTVVFNQIRGNVFDRKNFLFKKGYYLKVVDDSVKEEKSSSYACTAGYFPVESNTYYEFRGLYESGGKSTTSNVFFFDDNKLYLGKTSVPAGTNPVFDTGDYDGCKYIRFNIPTRYVTEVSDSIGMCRETAPLIVPSRWRRTYTLENVVSPSTVDVTNKIETFAGENLFEIDAEQSTTGIVASIICSSRRNSDFPINEFDSISANNLVASNINQGRFTDIYGQYCYAGGNGQNDRSRGGPVVSGVSISYTTENSEKFVVLDTANLDQDVDTDSGVRSFVLYVDSDSADSNYLSKGYYIFQILGYPDLSENRIEFRKNQVYTLRLSDFFSIGNKLDDIGCKTSSLIFGSVASSMYARIYGFYCSAFDFYTNAEGYKTVAAGHGSHSEGFYTLAAGKGSHAEGLFTSTDKDAWYSHASGRGTVAKENYQTVVGKYNADSPDALFLVGNGQDDEVTGEIQRSNALEVLKDGRVVLGKDPENEKDAVTKGYIDAGIIGLYPTEEKSGNIIYCDSCANVPVKSFSIRFPQSLDSIKVVRIGKNLFDRNTVLFKKNYALSVIYNSSTGEYSVSESSNEYLSCSSVYLQVAEDTDYVFSGIYKSGGTSTTALVVFFDADGNCLGSASSGTGVCPKFTTPHGCRYIRFNIPERYTPAGDPTHISSSTQFQIERGIRATSYEAYSKKEYTLFNHGQDESGDYVYLSDEEAVEVLSGCNTFEFKTEDVQQLSSAVISCIFRLDQSLVNQRVKKDYVSNFLETKVVLKQGGSLVDYKIDLTVFNKDYYKNVKGRDVTWQDVLDDPDINIGVFHPGSTSALSLFDVDGVGKVRCYTAIDDDMGYVHIELFPNDYSSTSSSRIHPLLIKANDQLYDYQTTGYYYVLSEGF